MGPRRLHRKLFVLTFAVVVACAWPTLARALSPTDFAACLRALFGKPPAEALDTERLAQLKRSIEDARTSGHALSDNDQAGLDTPEGIIAAYETSPGVLDLDLDGMSRIQRNALVRRLKADLKSSKGIDDLFETLYIASRQQTVRSRWEALIGLDRYTNRIREHLIEETSRHGFMDNLKTLGIKEGSGTWEALRKWREQHPGRAAATYGTALNIIAFKLSGHYGVVPDAGFLSARKVPPELIERAIQHGVDSVMPDLIRMYRTAAIADTTIGVYRATAGRLVQVLIAQGLLSRLKQLELYVLTSSQAQSPTWDPESYRIRDFLEWVQDYKGRHAGACPTASDEEWQLNWALYRNKPDQDYLNSYEQDDPPPAPKITEQERERRWDEAARACVENKLR